MRKINLIAIAILLIVLASVVFYRAYSSSSAPTSVFTVTMTDEGFSPSEVTISKGTKVIWVNEGENLHWPASDFHPTHGIYPEFDPLKGINPGGEWSLVLKIGKWYYHDHLHPNFTGTIEVKK